jgi:hypothetical protein
MKKIITLVCLMLSTAIIAQVPSDENPKIGAITGKVIDGASSEVLPYVSIVIKKYERRTVDRWDH